MSICNDILHPLARSLEIPYSELLVLCHLVLVTFLTFLPGLILPVYLFQIDLYCRENLLQKCITCGTHSTKCQCKDFTEFLCCVFISPAFYMSLLRPYHEAVKAKSSTVLPSWIIFVKPRYENCLSLMSSEWIDFVNITLIYENDVILVLNTHVMF